jgi:hypothetical protein
MLSKILATPVFITLVLVGLFFQPTSSYAASETKRHLAAGMDLFRWQEYDSNQSRLLSEQGLRLSLQAGWDDILASHHSGKINLLARLYSGDINYDGQTQSSIDPTKNGIFVSSTSRYDGLGVEIEGLHPLKGSYDNALLLGLGIDIWRRDIQESIDAQGDLIGGTTEDYRVLYSRLGLLWQNHGPYGHSQIRAGIKYPLRIDEQVIGITLHPGRNISLFTSYRLSLNDHRNTTITIYYDSLRLNSSPVVTDQNGDPWLQPQSQQDSIGIMIGIPF